MYYCCYVFVYNLCVLGVKGLDYLERRVENNTKVHPFKTIEKFTM